MTTPSGQIGLSDVNIELGFAGTTLISMNQSNVRTLAGAGGAGTQITMNELRGKSNRVTVNLTISSNTSDYNIYSNRGGTYNAGKTDITLTINSGITVYSSSTGSPALTTGTGWTSGDTITVVNNGTILGRGGAGGNGGGAGAGSSGPGASGGTGGPGLTAAYAVSVNNLNRISGAGGGGGGGGGGWDIAGGGQSLAAGGGGGGGGIGNGSAGSGGNASNVTFASSGSSGSAGNLSSSGGGGGGGGVSYGDENSASGGSGGSGGTYGASGSGGNNGSPYRNSSQNGGGGGAAGAAVTGNSNITWINTGTRNGAIT